MQWVVSHLKIKLSTWLINFGRVTYEFVVLSVTVAFSNGSVSVSGVCKSLSVLPL